jgi:hypothetical protein
MWASSQGVDLIFDRHPQGVTMLAVDPYMWVEARVALDWPEYVSLSANDMADVIKQLVVNAKSVRRESDLNRFTDPLQS